jgi:TOMM system kinase/cyclase fusion protein
MDYDAVVTQALTLLQREQRLSYRVLKLRLQLDDDTLEALKEDLIYAKKLAADEDGRVLVWTGGTSSAPTTASPVPLPATPEASPAQDEAAPVAPPAPEAERRQLTVMFCDLVDSTRLSSQLDPEEYRDVVRAYHTACTEVIRRYDGHIAQLLGDGLLVYFGYPQAHEDDAQRAVRAGLGIVEAIGKLKTSLAQTTGRTLAVRLGIHTGLVVIGAMGDQGRHEHLALGETPNIAARIQGLAQPNTVAISDATSRLVQGYFAYRDLGAHALRGVPEAMRLYHVLGESGATSRLDVAQPRGLTPLVGRESEVTLLQERWSHAKAGHGQVVLLSGEAGIGKSRLVQVLKDHVASESHTRWECRSSPYYQNTALYPIIDLLQRTLRWQQDETPEEKLATLDRQLRQYQLPVEEAVPLFAPLFSLQVPDDRYPPLNVSPQRQRQKTLESLVAMLLALAEREPVLFILEDLHWTDPTTLEFLSLLVEHVPAIALYTVLTCRPHFQPAWHHRSYVTAITVNRLSRQHIARVAEHVAGDKHLPEAVRQQIVEKTDGVPLFVEEMTKAVLESGVLKEITGRYELTGALSALSIPATLHDSLMARLDRLVTAKAVAQYGAVIGRQFSYALLHAVAHLDEATLRRELGRLVEAELIYQRGLPPGATYTFKHALIQDTAYESLLRSTRQGYHRRIAEVLQEQFPALVATQPELLARHYTEAGLHAEAIGYWQQAGAQAIQRSAHTEAVSHLRNGLALLDMLPDASARLQHELLLLTALGPPLMAIQGYGAPEVGEVYTRAHQLCQQVGETPQLFLVLRGLWQFYILRTELRTARELGAQLLNLARSGQDTALLLEAHRALGEPLFWLGEFPAARVHFEQEMAHYDPQQHRAHTVLHGLDPGVAYLSFAAWTLWCLGYPDQALQRIQAALTLTHTLSHPPSRAFSLIFAAYLHQHRREAQVTQERAEVLITLATEQGFAFWVVQGTIMRGWALATRGQGEEGIAQMRQGLTAWHASGHELERPYFLAMLAGASGNVGHAEAGLALLREALTLMAHTEERWDEAELYRLKGELLLQQATENQGEAEACFRQAISIAQSQSAKAWELRAATSLARLWQQQGKRQAAHDLLAPVYHWFTEGFDTADLKDAKALLHKLEDGR